MGHEIAGVRDDGQAVVVTPLLTCGVCDMCRSGRQQLCRERKLIGVHRPGGFAQRVVVPASSCRAIADQLEPANAVFVEPLANAVHAVAAVRRHAGTVGSLAVIGAGAIGLAVSLAALEGGIESVTIADLVPERLTAAQALQVRTTSRLEGEYEAIVDAVGLPVTRRASTEHLTPGGLALWLGLSSPDADIDSLDLVRQERRVVGSYAYSDADFELALGLVVNVPRAWIETVALNDAAGRFVALAASPGIYPKTVIVP
jgi:threonine dehydrogenase-like Zn-dependent dehydrogenase